MHPATRSSMHVLRGGIIRRSRVCNYLGLYHFCIFIGMVSNGITIFPVIGPLTNVISTAIIGNISKIMLMAIGFLTTISAIQVVWSLE